MKRKSDNTSGFAGTVPYPAKALAAPRLAVPVRKDDRADFGRGIERGLKRGADRDHDARAGFRLPQADLVCRLLLGKKKTRRQRRPARHSTASSVRGMVTPSRG